MDNKSHKMRTPGFCPRYWKKDNVKEVLYNFIVNLEAVLYHPF